MSSHSTFAAGKVVGRHEIVRRTGRGGMGSVFEALHMDLCERVAIDHVPAYPSTEAPR